MSRNFREEAVTMTIHRELTQPMEYELVQGQRKRKRARGIETMTQPGELQEGRPGARAVEARVHFAQSRECKNQERQVRKEQKKASEPGREHGKADVAVRVLSRFCEGVDLDQIAFGNRSLLQGAIEAFGLITFVMLVERWWYSHHDELFPHPAMESRAWVTAWKQLKPLQPRDVVIGFSADADSLSSSVNNPAMFWEGLQLLGIRAFLDLVDVWGRMHNAVAWSRNMIREANKRGKGRVYGMGYRHCLKALDQLQSESDVEYCKSGWMVCMKHYYVNGATQKLFSSPQGKVLHTRQLVHDYARRLAVSRAHEMQATA